ncbi:MAG TPA: DUF934 domain-containing protein [Rhodocyclaceae bacterium]|nr:DUF934 domain-containing protein [Rhodocyclaceae bacterium]HRQ46829.1 DUF934 domain-containing protein [Rhodocyclaceae bacterium]
MAKLIRNGRLVTDDWQIVLSNDAAVTALALPTGRVIVPLATWRARRDELRARPDTGVWLDGADDPEDLADDIDRLTLIAVRFSKFSDGRGYSLAHLLRSRFQFSGELRAIGEVLRDQFNYLKRCGFDTLQPQEGRYTDAQLEASLASLADFTNPYQAGAISASPLFRLVRRAA